MNLQKDENRKYVVSTGIFVRAQDKDKKWASCDISELTSESLEMWLKSDGGDNRLAENVVRVLLGYPQKSPEKSRAEKRWKESTEQTDLDNNVIWEYVAQDMYDFARELEEELNEKLKKQ
jgi:hypothetical protein